LDSLTDDELRSASKARGMKAAFGEGARDYMRRQMQVRRVHLFQVERVVMQAFWLRPAVAAWHRQGCIAIRMHHDLCCLLAC
jgi:hypothetical protein